MSLILITAPVASAAPVTLDEVKEHLRIEDSDQDNNLVKYIAAAIANLDGRDGWLGRALSQQTWELRRDQFCREIKLPLPPFETIVSVKYIDFAGTTQTVSSSDYTTKGGGLGPAILTPVYNSYWPAIRCERDAVQIRFKCGYGANTETLPPPIKAALLLMVGALFENRDGASGAVNFLDVPGVKALLMPYRVAVR